MKFTVSFKTPDATAYALADIEEDDARQVAQAVVDKYVRYNEYISVEFDTELGTATVLKARR